MTALAEGLFLAALIHIGVYALTQRARRMGRLSTFTPLSPDDYVAAKKELREISPRSIRSNILRKQIRETDHPGSSERALRILLLVAIGYVVMGVIVLLAGR